MERAPTIKQKVVVKGYVGLNDERLETLWYVQETQNFTAYMPGQRITVAQIDELIANQVLVVARRK